MKKMQLREDITQKDVLTFVGLVLFLLIWAWFTFEVILKP